MTNDEMYSQNLGFYPTKQLQKIEPVKQLTEEQAAYKAYVKQCQINRMSVREINEELERVRVTTKKQR